MGELQKKTFYKMKKITVEDVKAYKAEVDKRGPRQTSFDEPLPNGYWRVAGVIMTTAQRDFFTKEFIKQGLKQTKHEDGATDNNI